MALDRCPVCDDEIDPRGLVSHIAHTHDRGYDQARALVRDGPTEDGPTGEGDARRGDAREGPHDSPTASESAPAGASVSDEPTTQTVPIDGDLTARAVEHFENDGKPSTFAKREAVTLPVARTLYAQYLDIEDVYHATADRQRTGTADLDTVKEYLTWTISVVAHHHVADGLSLGCAGCGSSVKPQLSDETGGASHRPEAMTCPECGAVLIPKDGEFADLGFHPRLDDAHRGPDG